MYVLVMYFWPPVGGGVAHACMQAWLSTCVNSPIEFLHAN